MANKNTHLWALKLGTLVVVVAVVYGYKTYVGGAGRVSSATEVVGAGATGTAGAVYKNGTYSAVGQYVSPGGQEEVGVTLTVEGDTVIKAAVEPRASRQASLEYQGRFVSGFASHVVGKKLSELNLGKISGASLTPKGFNDAVAKIKAEAKL